MTTASELAEMAKRAGMRRGQMLLKVEDFRAAAAEKNEEANTLMGKDMHRLASDKFAEEGNLYRLAEQYRQAAKLM